MKRFGVWGVVASNSGRTLVYGFIPGLEYLRLADAQHMAKALNGCPDIAYWGKRIPGRRGTNVKTD